MKLKVVKLYDSVFLVDVWFLYAGNNDELKKWYKKNKLIKDIDPQLAGYVGYIDKPTKKGVLRIYIIRVENNDFYTLAHECIHLVRNVFDDRGILFNAENDEAIAYYHGYWLKRLWRLANTIKGVKCN